MKQDTPQFPWVSDLLADNFLRVYDVVVDIVESLQMSDVADIPVFQARVKWEALLPTDGVGWRDEYCHGRWNAVMFLKRQGLIDKVDVKKGDHRWDNTLHISAQREPMTALAQAMKDEFQKRSKKPNEQTPQPESPTPQQSPLQKPEVVTLLWLIRNVPWSLWVAFGVLLLGVFTFGALVGQTTFVQELLRMK